MGEVTQHDATMLGFHAPKLVARLKESGRTVAPEVDALLAEGQRAFRGGEHYRAFRLFARALGLVDDPGKIEGSEVAASFDLSLNRAIFAAGDTITLTVQPLFSLGHPLANRYTVAAWLETSGGPIADTEKNLTVTEIRPYSFDFAVDGLSDGEIAVGYRLSSSAGETLVEFRHAALVVKAVQQRQEQLAARFGAHAVPARMASTPVAASARETITHHLRALEQERTRFDGNWQRTAHPFGVYLSLLNEAAAGVPVASFPKYVGRLRYPEDIVLAEELADALATGDEARLRPAGDLLLAYQPREDAEMVRYRIFVPAGFDRTRKYPLIVALHSGAGEGTYFEWETFSGGPEPRENQFKQLAQEHGYIAVCPNGPGGFHRQQGERDVLDVIARVQSVYSVDPDEIFLTGWSLGSSAVWRTGLRHPELFRALAPVAAAATWLNAENTAHAENLPVLFTAAEQDFAIKEARQTAALARNLLHHFEYNEFPATSHPAAWTKAVPMIFAFFDRHRSPCDYLGQPPPGLEAEVFARGLVSTDNSEHSAPAFSPDGTEVFWSVWRMPDEGLPQVIKTMRREGDTWSAPAIAPFSGRHVDGGPAFSADGKRLYFTTAEAAAPPPGGSRIHDIVYVEKTEHGWSERKSLGLLAAYPELKSVGGPSFTRTGTLYFRGALGIYRTALIDGKYAQPQLLPQNINGPSNQLWTPFIAPDESYLLFSSDRAGGFGQSDLYISRRREDGSWADPVNLGEPVNTPRQERFQAISPDGKYLFFTRPTPGHSHDVYWMGTDAVPALRAAVHRAEASPR